MQKQSFLYYLTRNLVRLFMKLVARVEVQGIEKVPMSGGFIAVSNHIGRLDAGLVYYFLDRQDVILIVAEKYQKYLFWRWLIKGLNGIWIDRFNADLNAMREVLRRLKAGGVLVIAPEGTRSKTGALQEARPGASYLATKAGMLILPIAATGTEDRVVKERFRHLKRLDVIVRVGDPFTLPPLDRSVKDAQQKEEILNAYTDEMMCRIAAQLPERYWGFYAEHPRLRELLHSSKMN